jgi:hypothetical protein
VPRSVRGGFSGASLQTFLDKAVDALEGGTIDGRDDTILTWMPMLLDERGWEEVTAIMEEATDRVLEAQSRSNRRLSRIKGWKDAISAVVAVATFETRDSGSA